MKKIFLLILIGALLASCAPAENSPLQASGLIEASESNIATELSGRVTEVLATEGDFVQMGDPLLTLDNGLLLAQKRTLETTLDAANANVDAAQSSLEMAQLQYEQTLDAAIAAEQLTRTATWTQTKPSDFNLPTWYFDKDQRMQALQSEAEVAQAALEKAQTNLESISSRAGSKNFLALEAALAQARAAFDIAKSVLDNAPAGDLRDEAQISFDEAKIDLNNAQKDYDDALTTDGAKDVLQARARVAVARERYDASVDSLRAMQTGAQAPEVELAAKAVEQAQRLLAQAETAVTQAQSQLDLLDIQIAKLRVYAPQNGVILTSSVKPGEVVQAGLALMTLADLNSLTVTVYVPENRYGEIRLGDTATLTVDSYPGETFTVTVVRIANKAEYTPRNVQTQEERQTTVYAIELSVANPDGKLKPGMPADVAFGG